MLIGEALDLPIRLVVIPGHAFVRWDDGTVRRNIETTSGGEVISDTDYLYREGQCDPTDVEILGWGKSLTSDECYAELVDCAAQHRIRESHLDEAKALLDEAQVPHICPQFRGRRRIRNCVTIGLNRV